MAIYVDDTDRTRFLEVVGHALTAHDVACHAYCLMTNHYHLVMTTNQPNLAHAVHQVNSRYAMWWNRRHSRPGHVFQGRYGAQVIQEENYLLTTCAYVVLNPVRAKLVASPSAWRWSSYRATAGLEETPPFLRPGLVWGTLGVDERETGCLRYRDFVAGAHASVKSLPREPVLGNGSFLKRFVEERQAAGPEVPERDRTTRPPLGEVFAGAFTRADRARRAAEAFAAGYSLTEIGVFLDLHRTSVRRLLAAGGLTSTDLAPTTCVL